MTEEKKYDVPEVIDMMRAYGDLRASQAILYGSAPWVSHLNCHFNDEDRAIIGTIRALKEKIPKEIQRELEGDLEVIEDYSKNIEDKLK